MRNPKQLFVLVVFAAIAGICCLLVPYIVSNGFSGPYEYSSPLFPLLRSAWEKMQPLPTLSLLFVVGGILGFLRPKNWFLLGLSTALLFPVAAILEILKESSSHNIWPIEFVSYFVVIGGPAVLGSLVGSKVSRNNR